MGLLPKSLGALLKKNAFLKGAMVGSSIAELIVPIILFWIAAGMGRVFSSSLDVAPNPIPSTFETNKVSDAVSTILDNGNRKFTPIFCPKAANNVLSNAVQEIFRQSGSIDGELLEFNTFDEAQKYIKDNDDDGKTPFVFEFGSAIPATYTTMTDDDINNLTKVPTWDYTIHPVSLDFDTGTTSQMYNIYTAVPYKPFPYMFYGQVIVNEAILRLNGLFNGSLDIKTTSTISLNYKFFGQLGYKDEGLVNILNPIFATLSSTGFLPCLFSIVAIIVQEKETFLKSTLIMMGSSKYSLYFSWFIFQYFFMIPTLAISSLLFKIFSTPHVPYLILFGTFSLYYIALVSFCLFISAFFSKVKTAQANAGAIYILLSGIGAASVVMPTQLSVALSLFSLQSLFGHVNRIFLDIERAIVQEDGSTWTLLKSPPTEGLTLFQAILAFLGQIVVYFILTIYIDNVMPGEYNNPLPFWYPFSPRYWCCCGKGSRSGDFFSKRDTTPLINPDGDSDSSASIYSTPAQTPVGTNRFLQQLSPAEEQSVSVRIRGLVKTFAGSNGTPFNAVDNLNLDLMRGQIFSILGHNGAGKSTTINILTGLYGPTSGSVELYDRHGNFIDPHKSAGQIGICPQYNALYPSLTVNQHMHLFSAIKQEALGVNYRQDELDTEIAQVLRTLKLGPEGDNKQDSPTSTLSGGQKRKVCLALALLHKPSILILDEPSSGTDIGIQRQIWSLLGKLKHDTAILLSSHHLEEAEIGDRIGIMVKGQLMCCGSSMFLKGQFGVGYHMSLEKVKVPGVFDRVTAIDNSVNTNTKDKTFGGARGAEITTLSGQRLMRILKPSYVQSNIPSLPQHMIPTFRLTPQQLKICSILDLHSDNQSNLSFSMPYSQGGSIPDLLDLLDQQDVKNALGVVDTSLSITSLEDVFIMANDGTISQHTGNDSNSQRTNSNNNLRDENLFTLASLSSPEQTDNLFSQHDNKSTAPTNSDSNRLQINTSIWDQEKVQRSCLGLFSIQFRALFWKRIILQIRDLRGLFRIFLLPLLLTTALFIAKLFFFGTHPFQRPDYHKFPDQTPIYYSQFQSPDPSNPDLTQAWDNGNTFSKAFSTYQGAQSIPAPEWQQFIKDEEFDTKQYGAETIAFADDMSQANPRYVSPIVLTADLDKDKYAIDAYLYTNSTSFYAQVAFTTRFYETVASTAFPRAKAVLGKFGSVLNINMGIKSLLSHGMSLMAPIMSISVIVLTCVLYPNTLIYSLVKERGDRVVHLHRISGVSQLAYWTSYALFDYLVYVIMCCIMIGSLAIFKLDLPPGNVLYPSLATYGVVSILFVYTTSLLFTSPASAQTVISAVLTLGPLILMALIAIIFHALGMDEKALDFFWLTLIIPSSGVAWPLFQSVISGGSSAFLSGIMLKWAAVIPVYVALFWGFSGIINKHWLEELFTNPRSINPRDPSTIDPDVAQQEQMIKSNQLDPNEYPLVSKGLRKVFGELAAVNNNYFALRKKETFGLLGSNGAGKSTTIAMLTSEFISSKSTQSVQDPSVQHTATIGGFDIIQDNKECWKELGFCPQFDALNLALTARETLTLYCHLRGVTDNAHLFVSDLLNALGLEYAADRRASGFSLGMRRRLSIGVALVGNPGVVLLDEATTGVDPISRSNIRLLLQQTCRNRALLITSHNLEEIEALADNIGIMSRGEMKTMGSRNVLKRKLTNHYQLHLNITAGHELETCVRVLSLISGVALSQELEFLLKCVTSGDLLAESVADEARYAKLTEFQQYEQITPLSAEEFNIHPAYLFFTEQCRTSSPSGCYITESRHTAGALNISKDFFTLSTLFKKVKEVQDQVPQILTYSCSQVPLDQVFLEIVRKDEEFLAQKCGGIAPTSIHNVMPQQQQQQQSGGISPMSVQNATVQQGYHRL